MSAKQTPKQVINNHKKIVAKMVQSFILQASYQSPEKVKELYESFAKDWERRVRNVNERQGQMILSYDTWEREWKVNGYHKFITIPVPKQLPDAEREALLKMKTELIRLVYIIEGKTEHQRQRRELVYKIVFLKMRIRLSIKSMLGTFKRWGKKEVKPVEHVAKMQVV